MRTLKVAIYTLAWLTAGCLSHEANANPSSGLSTEEQRIAGAQKIHHPITPSPHHPITPSPHHPFSDIQGNWAQSFVQALATRDIIQGFPDSTFRPDAPVTRAQFAAIISKAFGQNSPGAAMQQSAPKAQTFVDLPAHSWAYTAIQQAYSMGFLAGYPNGAFNPDQNISKVEVLVSLANGLKLSANPKVTSSLNTYFQDASQIPDYARNSVAAATENRIVANYPNVALLNPNQLATRAEIAAFIYQALAMTGKVPSLTAKDPQAQYIAGYKPDKPVAKPRALTKEQVAQLRQQLLLDIEPLQKAIAIRPTLRSRGGGSSLNSPTAFGADWGDAFMGISYQSKTRYGPRQDGVAGFGFGLGNARKAVGLEIGVTVVDLIGQTGKDGTISFKLHRVLPHNFAIALGVENAFRWGSTDGGSSIYGVASKVFRLRKNPAKPFNRLTVSVGLGSDRFRKEEDRANGVDTVNVFGSVGLQALDRVSLIADWSGQDLYVGASIVPFRGIPLVVTPGIADVTGNAPGDGNRFIFSVGYGLSF